MRPGDVVLVQPMANDPKGTNFALRQIPEVSGAIVAMDPHTGRVLAMTGGYSYEMSQFNRVTQAKRQPGSSFKPFVYLAALDNGFTPSTLVLDAPFVADQGPGLPKWKPTNYNTTNFAGPTPLRVGVEESKNMMTARLGQVVGLEKVAAYAQKFGVIDNMPLQYSMLLGAGETTPLKLTTAYAMIVNGGKKITPTFIDRVQDREGKTIYRADTRPCDGCNGVEWTGQATPDLPDTRETDRGSGDGLSDGLDPAGRRRARHRPDRQQRRQAARRQDRHDQRLSGQLVRRASRPISPPASLSASTIRARSARRRKGAHNAAPVFRDFMAGALKDKPATAFRIPPGIRLVRVNAATGQLARPGDKTVIYEAFKPGTEPTGDSVVVNGYGTTDDGVQPASAVGAPAGAAAPHSAPSSGTGGLY